MLNDNINLDNKTILLTGAAGFIGANLTMRLIKDVPSARIIGIDNMNDYGPQRVSSHPDRQTERQLLLRSWRHC